MRIKYISIAYFDRGKPPFNFALEGMWESVFNN